MTERIKLIHPIYLDVPMLVSFAAAVEGGVAFAREITREHGDGSLVQDRVGGTFGFSALFNKIFDASVSAEKKMEHSTEDHSREIESKSHTEASVAILLYDRLTKEGQSIIRPDKHGELSDLEPGSLVELTGTVEKNAVDAVIDYMDAVVILSKLSSSGASPSVNSLTNHKNTGHSGKDKGKDKGKGKDNDRITFIRNALDQDRKRTPISNVLLRCSQPSGCTAIVTLRTENLRDLTLSELNKNTVRVVGKVTRVIAEGSSVSAFENYGMAMLKPKFLSNLFQNISSKEKIRTEFSDVEVKGPAVQVLPLMIFV